jgi:hypothetical protein
MTIRLLFELCCTSCGKQYATSNGETSGETPDEMRELAVHAGWKVAWFVPNGSIWDFCPECAVKETEGTVRYPKLVNYRGVEDEGKTVR